MAIKKFASREEALAAGMTIDFGNGEYGEGGETLDRSRYTALFEALKGVPHSDGETFILPDFKDRK